MPAAVHNHFMNAIEDNAMLLYAVMPCGYKHYARNVRLPLQGSMQRVIGLHRTLSVPDNSKLTS